VEKARSLNYNVFDFSTTAPHAVQEQNPRAFKHNDTGPTVVFTGRISDSEKADHYRLADLYVMPSSGEGFGIVYLEALACGVPVIGSKADGSREALLEGALGTLVDPRNSDEIIGAVTDILSGKKSGTPLSGATVEHFSSERFEKRVHDIVDCIAPFASSRDKEREAVNSRQPS
jgi:glycosyltransferase involved in cell wall biosynthesis